MDGRGRPSYSPDLQLQGKRGRNRDSGQSMEHHIIQVAEDVADGQRALFIDDQLSHQLDETQLQSLLKSARLQTWTSNPSEGRQLGTELYGLLNGGGGKLDQLSPSAGPA